MNYNYPINFRNINLLGFSSPTESFENLCKEFIEQEFETQESFVLWNPSNYPWIEAKPIKTRNWRYISFQAKLTDKNEIWNILNKSFWNWKICKIKQEDLDLLDILVIICSCQISEKIKKDLENKLKNEKKELDVIFFTEKEFESKLQQEKYVLLRLKYFFNENVERDFHMDNKQEPDKNKMQKFIWLGWNPSESDNILSNEIYEEYQMNKLCYTWTDSYTVFEEMEDDILDNIWSTLTYYTKYESPKLYNLLEKARDEIEKSITITDKWSRIKYLLPGQQHKRWVTLQHYQDNKVTIEIKDSKAIYKVNKK